MSKKDNLLKLKKMMLIGGLTTTMLTLTGCPSASDSEEAEVETVENEFDTHTHLILNIGDQTVIFRECDDDIHLQADIMRSGICNYSIFDNDSNKLFSGYTSSYNMYYINNQETEEFVRSIEDDLIEKGSKVYSKTKKSN